MINDIRPRLKVKYEMFDALNIGYKRQPLGYNKECIKCKWTIHDKIEPYVQAGGYHYHNVCYTK